MALSLKNAQIGTRNMMPAVALVSPAFWIAWIELIYSGEIYVYSEPSSLAIIFSYLLSTTAMATMLIIYGCFAKQIQHLFQKGWFILGAGALASLATVFALLEAGPVFSVLTGVFTSVLAMRFNVLFSQVNPKEVLLADTAALIMGSFIYGYVLALPADWQAICLCTLPFLGAAGSLLDGSRLRYGEDAPMFPASRDYLRLVATIAIFTIAINVVRGFYPAMITMDTFSEVLGATSVIFFFVKMAIFFGVLMLPTSTNLPKLCYYGILVLAFMTFPLPLSGLDSGSALELFGSVNALLNLVTWTLFAGISYVSGTSAVRVFGWGWGSVALGSVAGWLIGYMLYLGGVEAAFLRPLEIILIGVIIFAGVVVVNANVVNRLFVPVDNETDVMIGDRGTAAVPLREDEMPVPVLTAPVETPTEPVSTPETASPTTEESTSRKRGYWRSAMYGMAEEFGLSGRETDVLELLLKGYSKEGVSEQLFVSYNTVRSHVRNIYVKLDVHNQQELVDKFTDYLAEVSAGK